ncbi:hypothetical protein BDZ85DRAFT_60073 [Elsinoe ampelina]|uniref:Uncharacterized protein n=1 Tax=Elsinoe ampelina TaxID=302913 RepID=A0A6A6FZZ7_9PEZI|nr:hypothetical protein BDZ85DRAFT_60073 [Elsinoe ampelina]
MVACSNHAPKSSRSSLEGLHGARKACEAPPSTHISPRNASFARLSSPRSLGSIRSVGKRLIGQAGDATCKDRADGVISLHLSTRTSCCKESPQWTQLGMHTGVHDRSHIPRLPQTSPDASCEKMYVVHKCTIGGLEVIGKRVVIEKTLDFMLGIIDRYRSYCLLSMLHVSVP